MVKYATRLPSARCYEVFIEWGRGRHDGGSGDSSLMLLRWGWMCQQFCSIAARSSQTCFRRCGHYFTGWRRSCKYLERKESLPNTKRGSQFFKITFLIVYLHFLNIFLRFTHFQASDVGQKLLNVLLAFNLYFSVFRASGFRWIPKIYMFFISCLTYLGCLICIIIITQIATAWKTLN